MHRNNRRTGIRYEDIAADYLTKHGFLIDPGKFWFSWR